MLDVARYRKLRKPEIVGETQELRENLNNDHDPALEYSCLYSKYDQGSPSQYLLLVSKRTWVVIFDRISLPCSAH